MTIICYDLNSGCSDVLVPHYWLSHRTRHSDRIIHTTKNSTIRAISQGPVNLGHKRLPPMTAHEMPGLADPLISVACLTDEDMAVIFLNDNVLLLSKLVSD